MIYLEKIRNVRKNTPGVLFLITPMNYKENRFIGRVVMLLVFTLPLFYCICTDNPVILKQPITAFLTLICLGLIFLRTFSGKGFKLPRALSIAILLYLIINVVSFFFSGYRYVSMNGLEKALIFTGLYLVGVYAGRNDLKRVFNAISISAGFLAIIAITQYLFCKKITFGAGNPNLLAGYFILVIPFIGVQLGPFRNSFLTGIISKRTLFYLIIFLLTITALYLTRTRAAWAALFIASFLFFYPYLKQQKQKVKRWLIAAWVLVIFCLAVFSLKLLSSDVRPLIWRGTAVMIKERLLTGWGSGTYALYYPKYKAAEYFLHPQAAPVTEHAHSEFLELTAETGLPGLFAFLAVIAIAFGMGRRLLKDKQMDGFSRACLLGLCAGMLAFILHNSMSIGMRFIMPGGFFWFSLGLSGGVFVQFGGKSITLKRWGASVTILSLILLLGLAAGKGILKDVPGEIYLEKAISEKNHGRYQEAAGYYRKALTFMPYSLRTRYKLAYTYGKLGNTRRAIEEYQNLLNLAPNYVETHYNLGVLYLREGVMDLAEEEMKKAYLTNRYDVRVLCSLTSIYLRQGNVEAALRFARKALLLEPKNEYARKIIQDFKRD